MKIHLAILFSFLLLCPSLAHALSDHCPTDDWCACPGETQCLSPYATCEEACAGHARGNAGYSAPRYDPAVAAAQAEARRRQAITDTNNYGVQLYKQGNWLDAITYFQSALGQDPSNELYKKNLENAQLALRDQKAQEEANRKRAADNAAAMNRMGDVIGNMNFDGGTKNPASGRPELEFTNGATPGKNGVALSKYPPHGDPRIVDARNLPPAVSADIDRALKGAYPNATPEVLERLKKGFTAVENHDWKLAKAWFQDALKRDPTNVGLQRFVTLAQDPANVKVVKAPPAPPEPIVKPIIPVQMKPTDDAVIRFFNDFRNGVEQHPSRAVREYVLNLSVDDFKQLLARQIPDSRDLQYLFNTQSSAALQLPSDDDLEFLFDSPSTEHSVK